jgi:hypothetical protein
LIVTSKPTLMIHNKMWEPSMETSQKIIKIVYEVDTIITTVSFIPAFVYWYNNILLPLIRQFFHISNRINEYLDRRQYFASCLNTFCRNLITTWRFIIFSFAIAVSPLRQSVANT